MQDIAPLKMRLMRLCESEGAFNTSTYIAFRDDLTLQDALEIEAAMCEIGDRRSAYAEFYSKYKQSEQSTPANGPPSPESRAKRTLEDLIEERDHRQTMLERDETAIMKHRAAVAYAASGQPEPAGRLDRTAIDRLEKSRASNKQVLTYLTGQIEARNK